jgi:hypothetical protein
VIISSRQRAVAVAQIAQSVQTSPAGSTPLAGCRISGSIQEWAENRPAAPSMSFVTERQDWAFTSPGMPAFIGVVPIAQPE